MKFFIQFILIAVLAFALELVLPWWSIAIAAFVGGIILSSNANFGAGFLGIALFWLLYALLMNLTAAAPLAERVSKIFFLNAGLLMIVTAVLGGLIGGFAAMAGGALRANSKRSSDTRYYR